MHKKLFSKFLRHLILLITLYLTITMPSYITCARVGLCIMATGKYIFYAKQLIKSAQKYFCTDHDVTYFVFTDGELLETNSIKKIYQKRLGWPYDTLMRFEIYYNHQETLKGMDYIFATDADMLFVDNVGDEILSDRVAVQSPGFVGQRGTYETNSCSSAYVQDSEGTCYFAGGLYGGAATEFLKMVKTCAVNIQKDLENGYIAIWHDESHLNRYFIDNEPTLILSPSYCYPEQCNHLPFKRKLLALCKNHAYMRE